MNPAFPVPLPAGIVNAISREEIANLPIRRYEGEVCLVQTAQDLERAQADFRQESIVGFDTETRPSFRKGESYPPALVQVATAGAVYLFRLQQSDAYRVLAELLEDARIVKAGIGLADDLRPLKALFAFEEKGMLDLGRAAKRCGLDQSGLRNLAGIFLGFRIPKGAKTTNWAARQLSDAQINYAATDAWACRELFLRFHSLGLS